MLPTTTHAMRVCEAHLKALCDPNGRIENRILALSALFNSCHRSEPNFRDSQNALCNLGGIECLLALARDPSSPREMVDWVFSVIGQASFRNASSSRAIGEAQGLLETVMEVLQDPQVVPAWKKNAVYAVTNVIANAWQSHARLLPVVGVLVDLLRSSPHVDLKGQCVLTLGNFAYNPAIREDIRSANVLITLCAVLSQDEPRLLPASAAIALANLLDPTPSADDSRLALPARTARATSFPECFTPTVLSHMVERLVGAFSSSVMKSGYPTGSCVFYTEWKVAMAMSNLAKHHRAREQMLDPQHALVPWVKRAMAATRDKRLIRYCLFTLWLLCDEG